ncbi:MAG: membrane protein insertion efficiency factor YidD [Candidatus Sungbacteria bacterium RIFCSPLOWO2_01_FULL_59_16]|uniref:Putative membrane protein insertion efficiency factor n=1 Tax=Candidatus Sungbacteria bacterium RIFCSPLOWO2_01_FULL_59_16 TaxID=1802280 RepID=A0A1G2LBZ2_9BACT|nr:MAG: membrane protein insertion efficiency factor YidD [Candidatus Sungbacteria bacterium RIFCSPLOWO2_01_FULL_59_16]
MHVIMRIMFAVYRAVVSPLLHQTVFIGGCRFIPTCSAYGEAALRQYGLMLGSVLLLRRLIRCHPWSEGGYDPVSAKLAKRATCIT